MPETSPRTIALDYYLRDGAALFPIPAGQKAPTGIVASFARDWSRDPAQIEKWAADNPGCNFGIVAAASNWIIVDIDTKCGRDEAWAAWCRLCAEWGIPVAMPQVATQGGGWHIYFRCPDDVDTATLRQPDAIKGVINVRAGRGYAVAAGSQYQGRPYTLIHDVPPHPAPTALLAHCTRAAAREVSAGIGQHDISDAAKLYEWLAEKDHFADYETWCGAGMIARLEFGDDGFALWQSTFDDTVTDDVAATKWNSFATTATDNSQTLATLLSAAHRLGWSGTVRRSTASMFEGVAVVASPALVPDMGPLPDHPELTAQEASALEKFWAHLPSGKMIYSGTREMWTSSSVDKHIGRVKDAFQANGPGMLASTFLSRFRGVQSLGWDPSEPMIIEDRVLTQEGWIRSAGDKTFNRYVPPDIEQKVGDVTPWLYHIRRIYPFEADHIVKWFAHRVQRPGDKCNHALVFIGEPGIGKDTAIEPVAAAIGHHNFKSITASSFFASDFNGYLKSVMLRIDEVHDLGGESKYAFHDRTKPVIAAPPMAHQINEKFVPHYSARNVCGVILTSNHPDALYIAPDDRRHFVCISEARKDDFPSDYFDELYRWLETGGNEAVAHYLANLDLSDFNAKAPPPKTAGWHAVVTAGLAPESGDLADVVEKLGKPAVLTLADIRVRTLPGSSLMAMLDDTKMRKVFPKRLAECGYIAVPNPDALASGGRWRTATGRIVVYGRKDLTDDERTTEARALCARMSLPPPPC